MAAPIPDNHGARSLMHRGHRSVKKELRTRDALHRFLSMHGTHSETDASPPADEAGDVVATGRWLVAGQAGAMERPRPTVRPQAAFIAQLLAMRAGVPQARQRRRAEPDVGAAAYRDGLALRHVAPGLRGLDLDA